ncbi:hypothetical protein L1049_000242 [Liquidambar formosana]|uniref:Phytocyanin domain-containing protein n=1 Tax=Liquidambar formosana TaxID=63359 RepID=A0AAP0NB33_LIQFO
MANAVLRSIHQYKAFHVLGIFTFFLLMQKGSAKEFIVGGSTGWTIPPSDPNAVHYNQWAESTRFLIGDSLVFNYPADKDSVFHVSMDDYINCNTASPIEKFSDGHTVYTFSQSGPYYFVSGVKENCLKNEKMVVVVLADRSNQSSDTNQTSAAPPPPSGATEIVPTPAPAGEESPPPPPSGEVAIAPSAPPASEQSPPKSGASSIFISLIGSSGAFIGSCLLLVF